MSIDNNIDFKDHIVEYPNRFKMTNVSPGVVELVPTWIETPGQIIQDGTPVNEDLFEKLKNNVTCYSQTYTATEGQTVFPVSHPYNVGQSRISVYVGGVKQRTIVDFTEASSTSFILNVGLPAGTKVEAVTISFVQPLASDVQQQIDSMLQQYGFNTVRINQVSSEVSKKVDKTYVESLVASLGSGSPKGVFSTLSALQTVKPVGDSNIYLVTADGKWYYWNGTVWTAGGVYQTTGLGDNSVTYRKIKKSIDNELSEDLSLAARIPDKYVHVTTGGLVNYPNTTTGGVTDFIAVTPGEVIQYFGYSSGAGLTGWIYNSAKQPLVNLTSPATNNALATMTMPTNAAYVRVNYAYVSVASFSVKRFQLEKGGLDWLEVKKENLLNSIVEEKHLTSEVKEKLNIKDASVGIEKLKPETVTALQTTQVENGSVTLDKLSQSVLDYIAEPSSTPVNPFDGNNSTWIGDSITQGTGTTSTAKRFSNIIANKLSFSVSGYQNLGVGGSTIARPPSGAIKPFVQRVCDENQITSNRHRIFVLGGVNDFGQNVPLSSQDAALSYFATNATWNDSTFYGALHRIITYIRENHNDAELVFITPMHYALENTPNGQGVKMVSYVNAVKEVCTYYAVPYIDLWSELPIDPKNTGHKNKYTMNGNLTAPDGIHPNDVGNAMIANKIINFLKYQYIVR